MNWELYVSWRYLASRRKQVFTLFTTLIAIGGVMLGVAALVTTLSIMNGFQYDIRKKILDTQAHLIVTTLNSNEGMVDSTEIRNTILSLKEIINCAPFIYQQALVRNDKFISGVVVKGIKVEEELRVTNIDRYIQRGSWLSLNENKNNIVLGKELAYRLGVQIKDEVVIVSPGTNYSGWFIPSMKKFIVTGIFVSGMYEYDNNLAYVNLTQGQQLLGMLPVQIHGYELKINDVYRAGDVAIRLQNVLGKDYLIRSWIMLNRNLFSALKLEKLVMTIVLILIVLVAAFNILSSLMLMTMEKVRDIAILQAMGARKNNILRIFLYEGLIIGCTGTLLGLGFGIGVSKFLQVSQIIKLPADIYYVTKLPVRILFTDLMLISFIAVLISLVATYYPAKKAAEVQITEAIRYE